VTSWYALQVRGRYEDRVASRLDGQGYESFLPKYQVRRKWSDRMQSVNIPLFSGYLFCRFDPQQRRPVVMTPGVLSIVGIAKEPVPIAEEEIFALQAVVKSGSPAEPCSFLKQGDRVRVEYGPLRGVEGILIGLRGQSRVIVSVTLLQRSVAVDVQMEWLSAVTGNDAPQWLSPALTATSASLSPSSAL
jgi:transcription antitermination factor NusG